MVNAFISYSHLDSRVLERLKVHMAMLERDGLISTWTDRDIRAGSEIDQQISTAHGASLLFLPIVSPDFLNSGYCYDKEMKAALAKAEKGEMLVVPIIAEPCEWRASPLAKFKAVPRDGKPISEWTNENNAYLDIVTELRRLLEGLNAHPEVRGTPAGARSKLQPRIKRDFTRIDKDNFRDEAFEEIRMYFRESVREIGEIADIQSRYEDMTKTAFTCSIVNRARTNSESHITLHNIKGGNHRIGDIIGSHSPYAESNSANEIISVTADEYSLFLTFSMSGFMMAGASEEKLSPSQVSDILWREFIARAGIEYD